MTFSALVALTASNASLAGESAAVASGILPQISSDPIPVATPLATNVAGTPAAFAPLGSAAMPAVSSTEMSGRSSLAEMVSNHGASDGLDEQSKCLAGAVYYESKGESLSGQLAVARVIINRALSGRFANSLCGVVHQPGQFSFVRGGSIPAINTASRDWREAVAISNIALDRKSVV